VPSGSEALGEADLEPRELSAPQAAGRGQSADTGASYATDVIVQRFAVPFEYPVVFTRELFAPDNPALIDVLTAREPARVHRALVLVDSGVEAAQPWLRARIVAYARRHASRMELCTSPEVVPGGEEAKNDPALVTALQARFQAMKLDRHAFVITIGGGAMLDATGYAAATTHRGLRVVRVPTTVLSQNDSGVGVKNGVNALGAKNFLGTFAPPFAVLCDLGMLETLSPRDKVAGIAEAVKVSLIRSAAFFDWLEAQAPALAAFEPAATETMIRRGAELHLRHIATSGDPFENGSARPLDYGHWAAHKLEAITHHRLRHGEAVAIGMALDARYAFEVGMLGAGELHRICAVMERIGLRLFDEALLERGADGRPRVLAGIEEFREHLGGELTLTLLASIGRGVEVGTVDEPAMERAIAWLAARASR
jgi:3-dehydroquinate synthase